MHGWAEAVPSGGARRWREGEEGARARRAPRGGDLLPHLLRRPPGRGRRGGRGLRRPASGDGLRAVDVADDVVHVHGSDAAAAPEAREVRGGSGPGAGGLRRGRRSHHPRRRHAPPAHGPAEGKERRPCTRWPARLSLPAALCSVSSWRLGAGLAVWEEGRRRGARGKTVVGWTDGEGAGKAQGRRRRSPLAVPGGGGASARRRAAEEMVERKREMRLRVDYWSR